MADEPPPSGTGISTVASRFVSSDALEAARTRREQEWKDLHEKLGQEPPPMPAEEEYDPRSLYEKLKAQKDKKQEAFEEQLKFKNMFRQLDEDELEFFHEKAVERRREELAVQGEVDEELAAFKKAVAARRGQDGSPPVPPDPTAPSSTDLRSNSAPSASLPTTTSTASASTKPEFPASSSTAPKPKPKPAPPPKKSFQQKSFLAGAIKRKAPDDGRKGDAKRPASTTPAGKGS